jgi:hypothetical protein
MSHGATVDSIQNPQPYTHTDDAFHGKFRAAHFEDILMAANRFCNARFKSVPDINHIKDVQVSKYFLAFVVLQVKRCYGDGGDW